MPVNNKKATPIPAQAYFVPVGPFADNIFKGGSHALSLGYVDHAGVFNKDGQYVEYITANDPKKGPVKKRFRFDQSVGRFMTRNTDQDIEGKSQYLFLKNHVECEGSPNGIYETDGEGNRFQVGITFRELNPLKDAKYALDIDRARVRAEASVFELDDVTLTEVANILGYFGEVDDMMRLKVIEIARKKPTEYQRILNDDNRGIKALVRKATEVGVFKKVGNTGMLKWEGTTIGTDLDSAVQYLRANKDVLEALQTKLGLNVKPAEVEAPQL